MEENWAEEDEKDRTPVSSAMRTLQRQVGDELERELVAIVSHQPQPGDKEAHSKKVDVLIDYLEANEPSKCLVFCTRRVTCRLLSSLLRALLVPTRISGTWTIDCLMAQRSGADSFSSHEYVDAIANFRGDLR